MKYFIRFFILSIVAGLLIVGGCKRAPTPEQRQLTQYPERIAGEPTIRVRTLTITTPLELQISGAYNLQVINLNGEIVKGQSEKPVTIMVSANNDGVKIGKDIYRRAQIIPQPDTLIKIVYQENNQRIEKTFPGNFVFIKDSKNNLQLIIELPIEQYLLGVVAGEMPLSAAPEALKSQVVAARTYALYHIKTREKADFDVVNDVRSQVWNPEAANDPRARLAVNTTRGVVVNDNFRLFPTYFHSDCGGATANGKHIFPAANIPALQGVKCAYPTPHQWKVTHSKEAITSALARKGLSNGRLLRLAFLNENNEPLSNMGRVYFVQLFTDNGVERVIPANSFREAVGNKKDNIASTLMQATTNTNNTITFQGRGFGHGVGMCQHGAMFLSREQQLDYRQILRHYYPTATLVKLW